MKYFTFIHYLLIKMLLYLGLSNIFYPFRSSCSQINLIRIKGKKNKMLIAQRANIIQNIRKPIPPISMNI